MVTPIVWDGPPGDADVYLVRTPWDWYMRPEAFDAFLGTLPAARTFNAPPLMRACLGKAYLFDLEAAGVAIVPTEEVRGDGAAVARAIERRGWGAAVVKPERSANAHRTIRVDAGRPLSLGRDRWLVQPFVDEIADGELSFVFFDGVYSHAVCKRPRTDDFRVQVEHGGSAEAADPAARLVADAGRALGALGTTPLYARVDGVVVGGQLRVMELEVVEPELFFNFCAGAGDRLADALLGRVASG